VNASLPDLSVVIPVRNDAAGLVRLLAALSAFRSLEVIVVDGESSDDSAAVARRLGATVVQCAPGRGQQLSLGCTHARGQWLWLLHADSQIDQAAVTFIRSQRVPGWGRFDVGFEPDSPGLDLVAGMMNLRSRLTGICTGDQGLFVHRRLLEVAGGIPEQSLMEDVELSRRLKRFSRPVCSRVRLWTSSRRWRRDGLIHTIYQMWRYRLRYWWGEDPEVLAREYYD